MKNFLKISFTTFMLLAILMPAISFAATTITIPTLVVSSKTSDSVTLTATGLTIGQSYRVNIFDTNNVLKSHWDLISVTTSSVTSTSPATPPLIPNTYTAKISDQTPQYIATSAPFTISVVACGNGIMETGEQCDGTDLGGKTCATQGFASGSLVCSGTCTLDTSSCVANSSPATPTVPGWYYEMNDATLGTVNVGLFTSGDACQNDLDLKAAMSGILITKQCYEVTASSINPANLPTKGGGLVPCSTGCGMTELFKLVNNVINFILFFLAVPIAAIMFAYAGFLMLTGGGSTEKASKAKSIFTNVALGLVFAAGAWLIVNTILSILGYTGNWTSL